MQNDSKNKVSNKYSQIFPYATSERSQKFFGIVLTLCALSIFGLFAIRPTVSTIFKLRKEISDNQLVLDKLETKIKNLTELRKQYASLQNDLQIATNAITMQPDVHVLFAQIQSIAQASGVNMKTLQNSEVEILRNDKTADKNYYSYSFSVSGSGSSENISKFIQSLTNMERIVNIDTFSTDDAIDQNSASLGFNIQGTAFFKSDL